MQFRKACPRGRKRLAANLPLPPGIVHHGEKGARKDDDL